MLNLDNDEARKVVTDPGLIEIMRFLLLDNVVTVYVKALTVIGLKVGIRRLDAKAAD